MRIIKLEGEFFGQYKKLGPIYFPKNGTIGILGDTGAGKSTIFDAIEVSLFGGLSNKKATDIKHNGAKKSQKWWLELVFEMSGIQYRVIRHETTSKALLQANGRSIQSGQVNVTEHITKNVLGMGQVDFLNAFYAKQDEIESLNKLSNEQRKREVSKLLRVNEIDKALELLRKDKNKLNVQLEEQSRYVLSEEHFKVKLNEISLEKDNSSRALKECKKEAKEIEAKIETLKKQMEELDNKQKMFVDINNKLIISKNRVSELEKRIPNTEKKLTQLNEIKIQIPVLEEKTKDIQSSEKELELLENNRIIFERKMQLDRRLKKSKEGLIKQKKIIDDRKTRVKDINYDKEIEQIETQSLTLETNLDSVNKQLIDAESSKKQLMNDGKVKREELNNIISLGKDSECPVCKRELGEHHDSLLHTMQNQINELIKKYQKSELLTKNIESEKNELNKKRIELNQNIRKLRDEKELNQQALNNYNNELEFFKRLKEEYQAIEEELKELENVTFDKSYYEQLRASLIRMREDHSNLMVLRSKIKDEPEIINELKIQKEDLKRYQEDAKTQLKELNEIKYDEQAHAQAKGNYSAIFDEKINNERKISELANKIELLNSNKKDLEKQRKENEKLVIELSKRKEEFSVLLHLDEVYKQYKVDKLSKLAPSIAKVMQNLLSYLTDGKYDLVELDNNYNIFVYRNNYKQPLNLFSGGERKLISLVQRLSISQLITSQTSGKKFNFLALDEVLGSLDGDRQVNVLSALKRLNGVFEQILMISHNQDLNDMFDHTLKITQNKDLSSVAEWNSEWDRNEVEEEIIIL